MVGLSPNSTVTRNFNDARKWKNTALRFPDEAWRNKISQNSGLCASADRTEDPARHDVRYCWIACSRMMQLRYVFTRSAFRPFHGEQVDGAGRSRPRRRLTKVELKVTGGTFIR